MATDLDSTPEILEQEQMAWERRHLRTLRTHLGGEVTDLLSTLIANRLADDRATQNARLARQDAEIAWLKRRVETLTDLIERHPALAAAGAVLDEYQAA